MGPEQTEKFVSEELARWTPVLKATGLKAELKRARRYRIRHVTAPDNLS